MKSIFFIKRGFFESRGYSSRMLGNGAFVVQVTRLAVKSRAILTPASLIEAFDPVRFSALHEGSRQVQALAPLPCGISARYQLDGPNLRWGQCSARIYSQAPRDEKGDRGAGAPVGRDHAPHMG